MSKSSNSKVYDVAVVGSGWAGLTSAIYTTRYSLSTIVFGDVTGGIITTAGEVENYPGIKLIDGADLGIACYEQVKELGAEMIQAKVDDVTRQDNLFLVKTVSEEYLARAIILATGTERRKLGIPGEEELAGRGVSYCVQCDKRFFKDKVVAVVGGGNSAVEGALDLTPHAEKIYLIYRRDKLTASKLYTKRVAASKKIIKVPGTNVVEVKEGESVSSILLDKPFEGSSELVVDGIFIEIGGVPGNSLAKQMGVELSDWGYIKVNVSQETNLEGVFAAGDITTGSDALQQLVCAASEGAIAAEGAYSFLQEGGVNSVPDKKKVPIVNKEMCIGCGLCIGIAKNTFKLDDDSHAEVTKPQGDSEDKIQEAVDSCPVSAISWE